MGGYVPDYDPQGSMWSVPRRLAAIAAVVLVVAACVGSGFLIADATDGSESTGGVGVFDFWLILIVMPLVFVIGVAIQFRSSLGWLGLAKLWLLLVAVFALPVAFALRIADGDLNYAACTGEHHGRYAAVGCTFEMLKTGAGQVRFALVWLIVAAPWAYLYLKDLIEGGPEKRQHRREYERARRAKKRTEREALKIKTQEMKSET